MRKGEWSMGSGGTCTTYVTQRDNKGTPTGQGEFPVSANIPAPPAQPDFKVSHFDGSLWASATQMSVVPFQ